MEEKLKYYLLHDNFDRNLWRLPLDILDNGIRETELEDKSMVMDGIHETRRRLGQFSNCMIRRLIDDYDAVFTAAINRYGESLFITEDWRSEPELFQSWQVNQTEENLRRELQYRKQAQFDAEQRLEKLEQLFIPGPEAFDIPDGWHDLYKRAVQMLILVDKYVTITDAYEKRGRLVMEVKPSKSIYFEAVMETVDIIGELSTETCALCGQFTNERSKNGLPVCRDCFV